MKKGIIIGVVVVLIIVGGVFLLMSNKGGQKEKQSYVNSPEMVDCGQIQDPECFFNRMGTCLPVSAKVTGSGGESIEVIVLGKENGTCHFQRKINNVLNLDCYFPGEILTPDVIDQTFGTDKGLQKLVDDSCTMK
jgi:hypothetical protein